MIFFFSFIKGELIMIVQKIQIQAILNLVKKILKKGFLYIVFKINILKEKKQKIQIKKKILIQ